MDKRRTEFFRQAQEFYASGNYADALRCITASASEEGNSVELLVLKARTLQLSEGGGPISEVADCLRSALAINPNDTSALLEYGWFLLNVMDSAAEARLQFERCITQLRIQNTDAVVGMMKCSQELRDSVGDMSNEMAYPELLDEARVRRSLAE